MREIDKKLFEELRKDDLEGDCEVEECSKPKKVKEEVELDEGTSNFGRGPENFPLLVFYTYDEFLYNMTHDSDYPQEEQFEDEEGNVDWDKFEDAKNEFEQRYDEENDICVLDEDAQERLDDKLYDFNEESKKMAWDADYKDGEQQYGDNLNLEDVKLSIKPGYYSAAYIDVEHEDYLDDLEDDFKAQQMERFTNFFKELKSEFGLTQLSAGPMASNGERGYSIVKDESLEESEKPLDRDAKSLKSLYNKYIKEWEEEHKGPEYKEMEPACFDEWYDNEYLDSFDEALEESRQYDGKCPYCHSENIDFVDSDEDSEKHVCHDCGQDFLVHDDGHVTTRNNRPIDEKKSKKKKEPFVKVGTGLDLAKDTTMTNHMLGSDCCEDVDDFDEYDTDSYYSDEDICVYQFPVSFNEVDWKKAKEYGLEYLGKVNDLGYQPGDHLVKGKYKDLKRYCDEYLGYVMHPYYLYKEDDIDLEDILEPATESLKEEKEYLSDKVTQVLDDYGILYGDIVENGDGSVNIVGVDEEEWDEVVEAIKSELGLNVLVPDLDHDELDNELIVRESLNESMKSEVTKWWKDVEDANKEMKWEFNIDNGDYSDVEAMHAAMFDMLNDLKEKGASELFNSGKKIYNKYAISKYNEDLKESCSDKELVDKLVAFGTCDSEEEAKERVAKMSQEMKDEMCKSLNKQAQDHLLNDSLNESSEVARVEYCVMDKNNNNIECFDNTDDAIAFAKDNEGIRVLEVQYGPKDENGDEPELGTEEVWSIRESLKEALERYKIEYWVDEEARDYGLGDYALETFDDLEDAKEYADKLFGEVASVEVLDTQDNDKAVYGRYPEDESVITNDKNIDAIKDEVNPSDVIPQEEQDALAKGETLEEGGPGSGDHRDASQRYNDRMHAMFRRYDEMNNKMAKFLIDHGVKSDEVEELKSNTGLHGNALLQKLIDLGLKDEFFGKKESLKTYKAWSLKANSINEEIEVYVKNEDDKWEAIASVENCPTKDMLDEDIRKEYSSIAKKVLQESGYKLMEDDDVYVLHVKVIDSNTGKEIKNEQVYVGSKKECIAKKKQLEETSPEDSHHNKNIYKVSRVKK